MKLDEISEEKGQEISKFVAETFRESLLVFLSPLLNGLAQMVDKRLVKIFYKTVEAIITFRHSSLGLLLSELGGYILSPDKAPAGTKRLSNMLRCTKWSYSEIQHFLWLHANEKIVALDSEQETVLAI